MLRGTIGVIDLANSECFQLFAYCLLLTASCFLLIADRFSSWV